MVGVARSTETRDNLAVTGSRPVNMKLLYHLLVLWAAANLHAGFVQVWGIGENDDPPLLVVATVEGVAPFRGYMWL